MVWLSDGEKILKIRYSFWQNPRTWRTDRQIDGQTLHDGIGRAYAQHRASKMMTITITRNSSVDERYANVINWATSLLYHHYTGYSISPQRSPWATSLLYHHYTGYSTSPQRSPLIGESRRFRRIVTFFWFCALWLWIIGGHWKWHHSIDRIRLPSRLPLSLWLYLVPFHHITSHHKSYSVQSYRLKIDRLCITMSMLI